MFVAVAVGMVVDRYVRPEALDRAFNSIGGSTAFIVWWSLCAGCVALWRACRLKQRDVAAGRILLLAALFLGGAWHHLNWYLFGSGNVARYASYDPSPACIEAVASESPERVVAPPPTPLRAIPGTERSRLIVNVTRIRDGQGWHEASGKCQLAVEGHLLGIHPGDRLRVYGQLARPAPPLNPGEFDFAAHARADGQLSRIRTSAPECVVRLASGGAWTPAYALDDVRARAKAFVRSMIGPQRAGLAAAILLGAREGLPFQATEPYLETGTVHVLVVSGMNVAILATGLVALMQLGLLPRRTALSVIIAIVIGYALLAEAQPPVVRSAVVGVLFCLAAWTGRRGAAFNSLFAAALVVLAINPSDLFRAGPQLSFLAVAALIWVGSWSIWPRTTSADPLDELIRQNRAPHERAYHWFKRNLARGGTAVGRRVVSYLAFGADSVSYRLADRGAGQPDRFADRVLHDVEWILDARDRASLNAVRRHSRRVL